MTRNWRIYYIDENALLHIFVQRDMPRFLSLTLPTNLPPGAKVLDVRHSWDRKAFGFRVEHPSFDPVPDGALIPEAGPLEWNIVRVLPDYDNPERKGPPAYRLLDAALEEADRLRGVFTDLCNDRAVVEAAREQGAKEEEKRLLGLIEEYMQAWKKPGDRLADLVVSAMGVLASAVRHKDQDYASAMDRIIEELMLGLPGEVGDVFPAA
ncbi:MAG TPA: hypothetical protein VKQ27_11100 [Acetobacteraceae bacterium]|nr:hypothetical protein [Acetobacteraceae bacterium]